MDERLINNKVMRNDGSVGLVSVCLRCGVIMYHGLGASCTCGVVPST